MSTILVIPTDGHQLDHLRHALETWRMYGPQVDHVIVVGDVVGLKAVMAGAPVTFWPVAQLQNQPRLNQQRNLAAVLGKNWSEDVTFVWSHDDIYLARPFALKELEQLTGCGLKEKRPKTRSVSKVATATRKTIESLEMRGLPTTNYELHLPLVIRPEDRSQWMDLLPRNDEMQFRTWVLNHLVKGRPRLIDDVKIFKTTMWFPKLGIYSTAKNLNPLPLKLAVESGMKKPSGGLLRSAGSQ